ncbi:hypothetical protein F4677DRAFT_451511 [Hypoxylon crocopeplum]|nr:hypothetical protein F4677DRAFT_451511 [Hypoxylon crocopeplum]
METQDSNIARGDELMPLHSLDAFYHPDEDRPSTIPLRGGHFVKEDLGAFDAPFFSITPGEAASGIPIEKYTGSNTSVYTGCFTNDYLSILQQDFDAEQGHTATGISPSMLANRLSWFFNLKGTSMNVDTACSSSLVAFHLACQDLCARNSSMLLSSFNILSRDSRYWTFDQRANGYARGEGTAVVVVKRLEDALRDGDTIRAVIRNAGSNQDGKTPGITQPSQDAQVDLIRRTYLQARIDITPTRFFEAHATGTPVGDPIEGNAIGKVFRGGLAGLIKAILVLEKGVIPPIAGLESLNLQIDAKRLHLHFPTEPVPWPLADIRPACVNSFGFGGTNAVVILDDAYNYLRLKGLRAPHRTHHIPSINGCISGQTHDEPEARASVVDSSVSDYENALRTGGVEGDCVTTMPKVLVWSAPDQQGAQMLCTTYRRYLENEPPELDDLAYSLVVRRSHFSWKSFAIVKPETPNSFRDITYSEPMRGPTNEPQIAFVFTGQGAYYLGMGRQLLSFPWFEADDVFARRSRIPIAYHSRFMSAIADEYAKAIGDIDAGQCSGRVSMISSVSGDVVSAGELASPQYWVRNLTSAVNFDAAFSKLLSMINMNTVQQLGAQTAADYSDVTHILEVGSHQALRGPIRENTQAFAGMRKLSYMSSLVRGEDAAASLLKAAGHLYCAGYVVDLLRVNGLETSSRPLPPDLPLYPFSHSKTYWKESSLSRNLRFRKAPRHELLGARSLDWNSQVAQWRNIIRLAELPWLEDHKIGQAIMFPADGMIVMAVEGLLQLIDKSISPHGIHIRNATFSHAISFPQGASSIETQLTLSRPSQSNFAMWSQIRLFVLEKSEYVECFSGSIRVTVDAKDRDRVISAGQWMRDGTLGGWVDNVRIACQGPDQDPYEMMSASAEVQYGPVFRNLKHLQLGDQGEAMAQVDTESWRLNTPSMTPPSFAVHPATLGALWLPLSHALLVQRLGGLPTMVPVHVASIWLDCSGKGLQQGMIDVVANCRFSGHRGGYADVLATAASGREPLICVEGMETAFIGSTEPSNQRKTELPRKLCARLVWKPDLDTMSHEQVLVHCTRDRPKQATDEVKNLRSQVVAILCFIKETLLYVDQNSDLALERHLESYIEWMRYQWWRLQMGQSLVTQDSVQNFLDNPRAREQLNREIEDSGFDGFFLIQIGRKLVQILCGEVDPLDFMFREGLANRYYEKILANDHHAYPASQYIDLICFKNPSMNILEVGAGTGGQTRGLLEAMSRDGVTKWARYDYTDISPSFFGQAREKFQFENLNFRVYDISKDPILQGFEEGIYDLVVASHVLHVANKLDESLRRIRQLLKPGGKLLLFETTRPEVVPNGFAFGLLKSCPCFTAERWDASLRRTGFSGVDVDIPGQEDPYCRYSSIIVSTAEDYSATPIESTWEVNLVVNDEVEAQCVAASVVERKLSERANFLSKSYTLAQLSESNITESSLTIFLREIDVAFLDDMSEIEYTQFQSILLRSKNILWVTRAQLTEGLEPRHHLVNGMGRTLMSEDSQLKFVTLSLDGVKQGISQAANIICEIAARILKFPVEEVENNASWPRIQSRSAVFRRMMR